MMRVVYPGEQHLMVLTLKTDESTRTRCIQSVRKPFLHVRVTLTLQVLAIAMNTTSPAAPSSSGVSFISLLVIIVLSVALALGLPGTLQHSCLENPHGQRSLAGYSPWGHKELDTTE